MSLFDKINKGTYTATATTDESNFGVGYTYNSSYFSATGSNGYTFTENASSIDTVMWKDLTTSVVGSKYVMRFPFTLTSFTGHTTSGQNHKQEIGLGASYATGEDPTHDFVGLRYNAYQGDSTIKLHILARDGTTKTYSPALSVAYSSVSTPITWYMEIIKDDDSYTLNVYSDSSYSTSLGTATVTQTGITGLRYFNHHLFTQSTNGVSNGSSTGYDIYDGVTSVTNVFPQRVVENFSGSVLDTDRWTTTGFGAGAGNTTFTIDNEVDGGALMLVSSGTSGEGMANFNNIRQFSNTGSVFICVTKSNDVASGQNSRVGLKHGTDVTFNGGQLAGTENGYNVTSISSFCADASGFNRTNTSLGRDSLWHTFKGQLTSSDYKLAVDGVMETTDTTNLPTVRLQPFLYKAFNSGYTSSSSTRYYEAYNT